jgi:hypothetical protein
VEHQQETQKYKTREGDAGMKKKMLWVAVLGVLLLAGNSWADNFKAGDVVKLYSQGGENSGGPFRMDNDNSGDSIDTFCLERNEYFYTNTPYTISSISDSAERGGLGNGGLGEGNPDPISKKTAFLYYHFRIGDLTTFVSSFDYSPSAKSSLQAAIWFLEDEGLVNVINNNLRDALLRVDIGSWETDGKVMVANIVDTKYSPTISPNNYYRQSQLVLVPEPATMILLGFGLLGLAGIGRRRFKS